MLKQAEEAGSLDVNYTNVVRSAVANKVATIVMRRLLDGDIVEGEISTKVASKISDAVSVEVTRVLHHFGLPR